MGFLTAYIVIMIVLVILTGVNLIVELDSGNDLTKPARLMLSALIWPLLIPVILWWLVCAACERDFPTFQPTRPKDYRR